MFKYMTNKISMITLLIALPSSTLADSCFVIDKSQVTSGGCVTLTFEDRCCPLRGLTLQIDDREPFNLQSGALRMFRFHDKSIGGMVTHILISHDLREKYGFERLSDSPNTFRLKPVFDKSGIVRLSFYLNGKFLEERNIEVTPAEDALRPSLDLLYPEFVEGRHREGHKLRFLSLLNEGGDINKVRGTKERLEIDQELQIIGTHPDWSEIASAVSSNIRARIHAAEVTKLIDTCEPADLLTLELPPTPEKLLLEVQRPYENSYALVIQQRARQTISFQKIYLKQKQGR